MKPKLFLFLIGLSLLSCLLSGCTNLLIADNTVLTLGSQTPELANINALTTEQPGTVCDITDDGSYILSIGENNHLYTIDQYQIIKNSLVNLVSSDTPIFDVKATENGFFYTKSNPSNPVNVQIIWSTLDKTTERTVTDTYDNASETIYAFGKNEVVYINNDNELVFSDSNGVKEKYSLERNLEVSEITWSEEKNIGFITGRSPGEDFYTLYQLLLKDGKLSLNAVAYNVIDMDLGRTTEALAYNVQDGRNVTVYILPDIETIYVQRQFFDENIEKIHFSDDEKALYFSKTTGVGTRSTLWHYEISSQRIFQLTSPLRLNSVILPTKKNNEVFFSSTQLSYLENSDIIMSTTYINKLVYTTPSN